MRNTFLPPPTHDHHHRHDDSKSSPRPSSESAGIMGEKFGVGRAQVGYVVAWRLDFRTDKIPNGLCREGRIKRLHFCPMIPTERKKRIRMLNIQSLVFGGVRGWEWEASPNKIVSRREGTKRGEPFATLLTEKAGFDSDAIDLLHSAEFLC